MQNPKISTLTLTHNRKDTLRLCLENIRRHTVNPFEMIVIDNGSDDGTQEIVKEEYPEAILIETDGHEDLIRRNLGIEVARGEFILQSDDDNFCWPNWDQIILSQFTEGVGAVGPVGFIFIGWEEPNQGQRAKPKEYCDFLTGFCFGFRNIAGIRYNPALAPAWHEETFLQFDLKLMGWRLRACRPCSTHRSLAGPVPWAIHDRNLALLREKFEFSQIQFENFDQEAYLKGH